MSLCTFDSGVALMPSPSPTVEPVETEPGPPTREEILLNLRRVLLAAPEERFEMENFSTNTGCGTAYCLAGWARLDPWFVDNTKISSLLEIESDGTLEAIRSFALQFFEAFCLDELDQGNLKRLLNDYCIPGVTKKMVRLNIERMLMGLPALPYSQFGDVR